MAVAGHSPADTPSLPHDEYFDADGTPIPTENLTHPDLETTERERLQAIERRLSADAQAYRDEHGRWPTPDPGVGRGHPAVEALLPDGYDPNHGMSRDERIQSITGPDGNLAWADGTVHPNGFMSATDRHPVVLQPGRVIDRFGGPNGKFTSPPGVPYPERALPPTNLDGSSYHQYEVIRPLPVWEGGIAPQMGEPGLGVQHFLPVSVSALIEGGYLREIPPQAHAPSSGHGTEPPSDHDHDVPVAAGLEENGTPVLSPQTHPLGRPGFSVMAEDDQFYRNARKALKPLPGHYDVVAHGTPGSVSMDSTDGRSLSPRELAEIIRHRSDYEPGTPIRLLSCNTGHADGTFARQLAQALGTDVIAPDGYLYLNGHGRMGVDSENKEISYWDVKRLPGTFHRYSPDGNVTELTDRSEWEG